MSNPKNKRTNLKSQRRNKSNPPDWIARSKQLMRKKSISPRKQTTRISKPKKEPCSNCILPSLADLEKMFHETTSDMYESTGSSNKILNLCETAIDLIENSTGTVSNEIEYIPEENPIIIDLSSDISPMLVKPKLNCNDSVIIIDYLSDDSCKERPKKKLKREESPPKSCNPITNIVPQTESSNDSDVTVEYDINISIPGRFSPLPSTSKDNDTILKNDIRFNGSLISNESIQDRESPKKLTELPKEITNETSVETIIIEDEDEFPIIVCTNAEESKTMVSSPLSLDNEYNTIPLNEESTINISDLSIDDIISENSSILKKYSDKSPVKVTEVPPIPTQRQINLLINSNTDINETPEVQILSNLQILSHNQHNHINNESRTDFNPNINEIIVHEPILPSSSNNYGLHSSSSRKRKRKSRHSFTVAQATPVGSNNTSAPRVEPSNISTSRLLVDNVNISNINNTNDTETAPVRNIGACPICLDSLSAKSISSTICGHIFCMECIKRAVKTSKRCPSCRKTLKNNGYHQIFL